MKLGVLSDIHGNYEALKACVEYLEKRKVNAYVFLGDYSGDLPSPEKTINLIKELQKKKRCYIIRGNKEDYILNGLGDIHPEWNNYPSIVGMLRYSFEHSSKEDKEFYESLPITDVIRIKGYPHIRICHGSINSTKVKIEYEPEDVIASVEEDFILCGHTHRAKVSYVAGKTIWNPGSVGMMIEDGMEAKCMILHGYEDCWKPELLEIPYDVDSEIKSMHEEGLFYIAPYWSVITEDVLKGGSVYHGKVLAHAMDLCSKERGSCEWPMVPEEYMRRAVSELIYLE